VNNLASALPIGADATSPPDHQLTLRGNRVTDGLERAPEPHGEPPVIGRDPS
jgi:hypothetical protein